MFSIKDNHRTPMIKQNSLYRQYSKFIGYVVSIEGLIGAGKSTLGQSLEKFFKSIGINAKFFPEYKNIKLLNQYISNMTKYAYSFQSVMLSKRLEIYRMASEFAAKGGVAIIDRSIIGDITFARMQVSMGNITPEEYQVYESIIEEENILEPNLTIYLDVCIDTVMRRIQKRGIESEISGYSKEYIQTLNENYLKVLNTIDNVIYLNHDQDIFLEVTDKEKYLPNESIIQILDQLY